MGKRKRKYNDESIRRKIRRLEKKLRHDSKHLKDHDDRSDSSRSSYSGSERHPSIEDFLPEEYPEPGLASTVSVVTPPSTAVALDQTEATDYGPKTTDRTTNPVATENNVSPEAIPDEILLILGEAKTLEEKLGEEIPKEISERWGMILLDGLAKEQKESLIENMPTPANFLLARAPKLNPEVNAVLSDTVKNRDKRLEKAQNQLGAGISGLVNLTKDLVKSELSKLEIIKKLSEVSQILLDLHYEETINRRKLILPLLDKSFWSTTIHGVKRDTYLFGDKLGENIKNTKDIEKTSQHIKKPTFVRSTLQRKNFPSGNVRFPPRQQNNSRPAAAAPAPYHEPQPSTSSARRNMGPTQGPPRTTRLPANKSRDRRRR